MRSTVLLVGVAAFSLVTAVMIGAQAPASGGLEVLRLRPNFYLLAGAGGNVAVQVGEDGVVVVDSGSAATASSAAA